VEAPAPSLGALLQLLLLLLAVLQVLAGVEKLADQTRCCAMMQWGRWQQIHPHVEV
jgi:hypothetical protein